MVVDTAKVSVCPHVSSLMRRDKKAATPNNYESKELLRKGMITSRGYLAAQKHQL